MSQQDSQWNYSPNTLSRAVRVAICGSSSRRHRVPDRDIDKAAAKGDFRKLESCLQKGESLQAVGSSGKTPIESLLVQESNALPLLRLALQYQSRSLQNILEFMENFSSGELVKIFFSESDQIEGSIINESLVLDNMSDKLWMRIIYGLTSRFKKTKFNNLKKFLFWKKKSDILISYLLFSEKSLGLEFALDDPLVDNEKRKVRADFIQRLSFFLKSWSIHPDQVEQEKLDFNNYLIALLLSGHCFQGRFKVVVNAVRANLAITPGLLDLCRENPISQIDNKMAAISLREAIMALPGDRSVGWLAQLVTASADEERVDWVKRIITRAQKIFSAKDFTIWLTVGSDGKGLVDFPDFSKFISPKIILSIFSDLIKIKDGETLEKLRGLVESKGLVKYMVLANVIIKIDSLPSSFCGEEKEELCKLRVRVYAVFRSALEKLNLSSPSKSTGNPVKLLGARLHRLENDYGADWIQGDMATLDDCVSDIKFKTGFDFNSSARVSQIRGSLTHHSPQKPRRMTIYGRRATQRLR